MSRTALVMPIPEAEDRFGDLRRRLDPDAAHGLPAHVTVLFPFLPLDQVDDALRRRLKRLFGRQSPFVGVFDRVGRFPATAWLAPVQPAPFVQLMQAVVREFPQCPPSDGEHEALVPHLTLAHGDAALAAQAEQQARALLDRHGAVSAHCARVQLLEDSSGRWQALHEFPLVGHQG
ncbi:MAG: 2'-5' RNA ligase family protein [Comamonadaceae bacterium]|nr:MAG: 2'-5' RNA ligase family protein [Comamonadaceae bacterium]